MIPGSNGHDFCSDDVKAEDSKDHVTLMSKFIHEGVHPNVADKLALAVSNGVLDEAEIDENALVTIKEVGEIGALACIQELVDNPTTATPKNRVAYLCGMMKTFKMRNFPANSIPASNVPIKPPDAQKIEALRSRLGLPLDITSGQRQLGPPPGWAGPPPTNEIFIGHLPYDIFEDELIPLFERFGEIYNSRIMLDPSGQFCPPPGHKGFAFINFMERQAAERAINEMNGYEIRGKKMKVSSSFQNTRLFIGNLPKTKSKEEIMEEIAKTVDGCVDVIVYPDINDDRVKNRGFCFADFDCHKNASGARRRFTSCQSMLFGRTVMSDWADPIQEPDAEIMSKVRVLYVKNLRDDVTEEALAQKASEFGPLEKCKKIKNYAFVTFRERPHALNALKAMDGFLMGGVPLNVTLARPQTEEYAKKKEERKKQLESLTANRAAYGGAAVPAGYPPYSGYPSYEQTAPQPRMPFRGAPRGGIAQRGARGAQRGATAGRVAFRGGSSYRGAPRAAAPAHYSYAPPPPPAADAYSTYPPYAGGYVAATDPTAAQYYASPYEAYDYSQSQHQPPAPAPAAAAPPVAPPGAPPGYPPYDPNAAYAGYAGGYAAPYPGYESYDYSSYYATGGYAPQPPAAVPPASVAPVATNNRGGMQASQSPGRGAPSNRADFR